MSKRASLESWGVIKAALSTHEVVIANKAKFTHLGRFWFYVVAHILECNANRVIK